MMETIPSQPPMSTSFTPGPWCVEEDDIKIRIPGVCASIKRREKIDPILDAESPIDVEDAKARNVRRRANFQLIAAAPDLYEACKLLANVASKAHGLKNWPELQAAIDLADEATDKAELPPAA